MTIYVSADDLARVCMAVVRPNGAVALIAPRCSENDRYCDEVAKKHYGEVAWKEMVEAGYSIRAFRLAERDDVKLFAAPPPAQSQDKP